MNDIVINNLDLGYEQCKEINSFSLSTGDDLLNNLSSNIANLKAHWVSSDATAHINNLINVYNGLGALIQNAVLVTYNAAESMISVQKVRNANGGGGMIGESLTSSMEFTTITPAEATVRYDVDPSILNDLATLETIFDSYNKFLNDFTVKKDELLSNWLAGANRERAVNLFESFADNTSVYTTYFNEAISNLSTATTNINNNL